MTKVYLLGPMTGYPEENRPAFRAAAIILRRQGFEVVSPDELDDRDPARSSAYPDLLRRDVPWVIHADAGVALPGWRNSKGASMETTIMGTLGIPVFELIGESLRPVPAHLLPVPAHPALQGAT